MDRGLALHAVLLGVATSVALVVWTRDKSAPVNMGDVTIWNARPADVEHVAFVAKDKTGGKSLTKTVSLDAHKDSLGTWFSGVAEVPGRETLDAGPPATKKTILVSVTAANKLAEAFAPLRALRELGRIGDDRADEFGLKDPEGSLSLTIAGKEHQLSVGAHTPGGGDRYVRDSGSSIVYVVRGDATRDLESADTSFVEREVHELKDADIESVRVAARGRTRELLRRGPDSKRIWSDPSRPDAGDETFANWMSKLDRLRPLEYPASQPERPEIVARLDYTVKGQKGVFLELAKTPAAAQAESPSTPAKPDFLVRTERTRQWAKVTTSVAEQVDQDLGSVLK